MYVDVSVFFFKQKTAYEMRISDWSSDVCSSDLRLQLGAELPVHIGGEARPRGIIMFGGAVERDRAHLRRILGDVGEPVAAREIADTRRRERRAAREGANGEQIGRASCRERGVP